MKLFAWASAPMTAKVATVFGILGSLAGILSLYLVLYPVTRQNPDIVGRWETDYSYPITGGTLNFKGMTSYLHEGKYNVGGVITLEGEVQNEKFKFLYNVTGAGTWTADDHLLSISLISFKTMPKAVNMAGFELTPESAMKLSGKPLPTLNDAYPDGSSDEFVLLSVKPQQITLQATDPSGKPFNIELRRQISLSAANQ